MAVVATADAASCLTVSEAKTDDAPANEGRGKRVVRCHFSRPGTLTNDRVCALWWGFQPSHRPEWWDRAVVVEGVVIMLPASYYGYVRPSGRAIATEGADDENAEIVETLVYKLRQVDHSLLRRYLDSRKRKRDDHNLSYAETLVKAGSASLEATVRKRQTLFRSFCVLIRMEDERVGKRVIFGALVEGTGSTEK